MERLAIYQKTIKFYILLVVSMASCKVSSPTVPSISTYSRDYSYVKGYNVNDIVFKAKILTTVNYGFVHPDSLVSILRNQPYKITYLDSELSYMTILIENQQPFLTESKGFIGFHYCNMDSCSYVVVFSFLSNKFFRIKGFEQNDYRNLYLELDHREYKLREILFDSSSNKPLVDIQCYKKKYLKKMFLFRKAICDCPCENKCKDKVMIY